MHVYSQKSEKWLLYKQKPPAQPAVFFLLHIYNAESFIHNFPADLAETFSISQRNEIIKRGIQSSLYVIMNKKWKFNRK
jgi:hypothetical protein